MKKQRAQKQYLLEKEIKRTRTIIQSTPRDIPANPQQHDTEIGMFQYNNVHCQENRLLPISNITPQLFENADSQTWLNFDVLNRTQIETIGKQLNLHFLIIDDILSVHQRPKMDEIDGYFTCVMQMIYYNETEEAVVNEQVSFVLGKNYLLTFQDEARRDLFNPIRDKLKTAGTKLRSQQVDYLLYLLIDSIVDHYFTVLEKIGDKIESIEEELTKQEDDQAMMSRINRLRKELIFFKRNTAPVREMINAIIRADNPYIASNTIKYFKDIYDQMLQVNDLSENYRDLLVNIRDLYLSRMNMKLNEIMKFLAIVTTLLAPATVIGGIFGMNFDRIPYLHHQDGFWIATLLMIAIPIAMLAYFRRRNWF